MVLSLLEISRERLKSYLDSKEFNLDEETKKNYPQFVPCFINILKDGEVIGSSGRLNVDSPLWAEVMNNTIKACFSDSNFFNLEKKDLNKIKIEIIVLSNPEKLLFDSSEDLLKKINNKSGIILKKGFLSSMFSSKTWEKIPYKKKFLEQLSLKAGLGKDAWKEKGIEIYLFSDQIFFED